MHTQYHVCEDHLLSPNYYIKKTTYKLTNQAAWNTIIKREGSKDTPAKQALHKCIMQSCSNLRKLLTGRPKQYKYMNDAK